MPRKVPHLQADSSLLSKNSPSSASKMRTLISLRLCVQQILHIYFTNNLLASHSLFAIPHNLLAFGIIYLLSIMIYLLSFTPLLAFPEGDKLLIGHGWPEWRPKGDMTCLPCLRLRRMEELCRSSTFSRTAVGVMRCWLRTPVELLQSSYTYGTTVRQGSRFAPTLPYQAFNPFGVGELWEDIWRVLQRRMARREWNLERRGPSA